MTSAVFIDFDDTVCLSSELKPFFVDGKFHNIPNHLIEALESIDHVLVKFFMKHLFTCKFRIITSASQHWVFSALKLTPKLFRLINWNYVPVVFCSPESQHAVTSKCDKILHIISKEEKYDNYVGISDNMLDLDAFLMLNPTFKTRTILTLPNPSRNEFYYQWNELTNIFSQIIKSQEIKIHRYFTLSKSNQLQTIDELSLDK